jgi:hypothetical protein
MLQQKGSFGNRVSRPMKERALSEKLVMYVLNSQEHRSIFNIYTKIALYLKETITQSETNPYTQ